MNNNYISMTGLSKYLSVYSFDTVYNKTFDYNSNHFINFPFTSNAGLDSNIVNEIKALLSNLDSNNLIALSNLVNQINSILSNLDSNIFNSNLTSLSNTINQINYNVSNNTFNISVLQNELVVLNAGISNNQNDILGLSAYSSNFALQYQIGSLNQGYSNNNALIVSNSGLIAINSFDISSLSLASSNYGTQSQINSLNEGFSNNSNSIAGLSVASSNYGTQSQINSLNEGYSNNSNSITGLSVASSNYGTQSQINSLNEGFSNNSNSIAGLSVASSNYGTQSQINSLSEGFSNNSNSITSLSVASSNYGTHSQINSLNEGYSNNSNSIASLSEASSNYGTLSQINSLNEGFSNNSNSITGLSVASSNYGTLSQINSLNQGFSNNSNSITSLSAASSNYGTQSQINSLNQGYSNNYNSITSLSVASSNYALQYQVNSLNQGYSNNYNSIASAQSSITGLSVASSNYITNSSINTLTNKTMDYNNNTFLNFPTSGSTSNIIMTGSNLPITIRNIDNPYKFRATSSNYMTFPVINTYYKIPFENIDYDINNNYNTSNSSWTCPINGYYDIRFNILFNGVSSGNFKYELLKNDTDIIYTLKPTTFTVEGTSTSYQELTCEGGDIYNLNTGDNIIVRGYNASSYASSAHRPKFFTGHLLSVETASNISIMNTSNTYYTSNIYQSNNYTIYSTSNYSLSNYSLSNYSTSNYFTSNINTSNNYGTDIRNIYNPYFARVFMDATQSDVVSGAWNTLPVNQFEYEGGISGFNTSTYTLTIPIAGLYRFSYGVEFSGGVVNDLCHTRLLKNGNEEELHKEQAIIKSGQVQDITLSDIIELNQGDTIILQAKADSTGNVVDILGAPYYLGGTDLTHFSWTLEAATGVITNSNLYLNTSAVQTASNFTAFAGYSNSLIATNMWVTNSNVGINTSAPNYCLDLNCTGALRLPRGTDAQRAQLSNADGLFRYNTTSNIFEGCSNNRWGQIGGSTGAGSGIATDLQTLTNTVNISGSVQPQPGYVLVANSASNASWSNISNSGFITGIKNPYKARAYLATNSAALTAGTWIPVKFGSETYDLNNNFTTGASAKYTAPVAGYYQINANVTFTTLTANKRYCSAIFKNSGIIGANFNQNSTPTDYISCPLSDHLVLAVNDVIEISALHEAGVNTPVVYGEATGSYTFVSITLVSPTTPTGADYSLITAISNPYKARASKTANSGALTAATWTKVVLDKEIYDPNNNFDPTTNYRYTAPITGYYQINCSVLFSTLTASKRYSVAIYKNGSLISTSDNQNSTVTDFISCTLSDHVLLNATDYIEMYVKQETGANSVIYYLDPYTMFSITLISV